MSPAAKQKLRPAHNDLDYWKAYFQNRVQELEPVSGTVWSFVCACILLEVLTKLVNGKGTESINKSEYEQFIRTWLPSSYDNFRYQKKVRVIKSGTSSLKQKSLPNQMYLILRCGVVHSYSFVPGQREIDNGGQIRSIFLTSKKGGSATQTHLSNFSRKSPLPLVEDAAFFVAEDFLKDIENAIEKIFLQAKTDSNLRQLIFKHIKNQRPIGG